MRNLILCAGHCNVPGKDRGASGNGFIEGELAVEFVELLKSELNKIGVRPHMDKHSNVLVETLAAIRGVVGKKDVAVEIHWNAGPPTATGVEVIVPGRQGLNEVTLFEKTLATKTSDVFADVLNIKNRGVKTEAQTARKKLGWMRVPCENNLVEVCFISNKSDMDAYQANKQALARAYASILKTSLSA